MDELVESINKQGRKRKLTDEQKDKKNKRERQRKLEQKQSLHETKVALEQALRAAAALQSELDAVQQQKAVALEQALRAAAALQSELDAVQQQKAESAYLHGGAELCTINIHGIKVQMCRDCKALFVPHVSASAFFAAFNNSFDGLAKAHDFSMLIIHGGYTGPQVVQGEDEENMTEEQEAVAMSKMKDMIKEMGGSWESTDDSGMISWLDLGIKDRKTIEAFIKKNICLSAITTWLPRNKTSRVADEKNFLHTLTGVLLFTESSYVHSDTSVCVPGASAGKPKHTHAIGFTAWGKKRFFGCPPSRHSIVARKMMDVVGAQATAPQRKYLQKCIELEAPQPFQGNLFSCPPMTAEEYYACMFTCSHVLGPGCVYMIPAGALHGVENLTAKVVSVAFDFPAEEYFWNM